MGYAEQEAVAPSMLQEIKNLEAKLQFATKTMEQVKELIGQIDEYRADAVFIILREALAKIQSKEVSNA